MVFSVELDLNDTAQAAQLQRELDRIQELRQKQVCMPVYYVRMLF